MELCGFHAVPREVPFLDRRLEDGVDLGLQAAMPRLDSSLGRNQCGLLFFLPVALQPSIDCRLVPPGLPSDFLHDVSIHPRCFEQRLNGLVSRPGRRPILLADKR
jgi:hypothetical protein